MLAACVTAAVLLIAAAAFGAGTLTGRSFGNSAASGPHPQTRNVASPSAAARSRAHGSPKPSPSSALDWCLFGTWKQTLEQIGASTIQYGSGATYTARVNGNLWSEVVTGSGTYNYTTQNGMMLFSDVITHGTQALYENGSYNNGGPLTLSTQPERYTCSASSLVVFEPNGGP